MIPFIYSYRQANKPINPMEGYVMKLTGELKIK